MLNGATTKLRNAQARIATREDEAQQASRRSPCCSFFAGAAVERLRREEREAIARLFPAAARRRSSRGGKWPVAPLCAAAMQPQQPIKRLDELFAAEPDRLSRLSFEVAGNLFRLVEDPPRPSA